MTKRSAVTYIIQVDKMRHPAI